MSADGTDEATEEGAVQDKQFFSFPYDPYDIQLQLMKQLYATIDRQHVGIFESPTGTVRTCACEAHLLTESTTLTPLCMCNCNRVSPSVSSAVRCRG